jgi:putative oxidoreductase
MQINKLIETLIESLNKIPDTVIALLGRFSVAAVFWLSGQTKIEGFILNIVSGEFHFGWPMLSDSVVALFQDEYRVPLLSPELGALMAAFGEHVFPALLLLGLATRFSALALLVMTATIQIFVYPDAYPTHGVWAAVLLYLVARGPGVVSLDHWIAKHYGSSQMRKA